MNLLTENISKLDIFNKISDNIKQRNVALSFKDIMDIEKAFYVYSLTRL